jgi:hypothetical protein
MRKVESCFQQLEQLSLVLDSKAKNRPAHRKADTTVGTIRLRLLKIGAIITRNTRRIRLRGPGTRKIMAA